MFEALRHAAPDRAFEWYSGIDSAGWDVIKQLHGEAFRAHNLIADIVNFQVPKMGRALAESLACANLAIEFGLSILDLVALYRLGSALALLRPMNETLCRAIWIREVADANQVDAWRNGRGAKADRVHNQVVASKGTYSAFIKVLETRRLDTEGRDAFHDFTHGMYSAVLRRGTTQEASYSDNDFLKCLKYSTAMALTSAHFACDQLKRGHEAELIKREIHRGNWLDQSASL